MGPNVRMSTTYHFVQTPASRSFKESKKEEKHWTTLRRGRKTCISLHIWGKRSFRGQREWLSYFIWADFSSATWAFLVFLLTRKQLGYGHCLTGEVRVNFFHLDCIKRLPFAHLPPPKPPLLLPSLPSNADVLPGVFHFTHSQKAAPVGSH